MRGVYLICSNKAFKTRKLIEQIIAISIYACLNAKRKHIERVEGEIFNSNGNERNECACVFMRFVHVKSFIVGKNNL